MPWNAATFRARHMKDATVAESKVGAEVANAELKRSGDDGKAVRAGVMAIHAIRKKGK